MNELFINKVIIDWDSIEEGSYLRDIPAINNIEEIEFNAPITFLAGENGTGKSTLLEAIAVAYGFNPEGGSRNYSFSTYDSHSELCDALTISKGVRRCKWGYFLRAESFYNVATKEIEYSAGGTPHFYHEKSHGESFLSVLQDNIQPNSMYILDEPEAALSTQRQLTVLSEMVKAAKKGAQFIVATHSPILLGTPDAEIYCFDNERPIQKISYEETDSYIVTKAFVENREKMLKYLLEE